MLLGKRCSHGRLVVRVLMNGSIDEPKIVDPELQSRVLAQGKAETLLCDAVEVNERMCLWRFAPRLGEICGHSDSALNLILI